MKYPLSAKPVLLPAPHTLYFKTQIALGSHGSHGSLSCGEGFGGVSVVYKHNSYNLCRGGVWWGKQSGRQQIKIPILQNACHTIIF